MEHQPALYAPIQLHAELGGKIKDNARQAATLQSDMQHVDAEPPGQGGCRRWWPTAKVESNWHIDRRLQ